MTCVTLFRHVITADLTGIAPLQIFIQDEGKFYVSHRSRRQRKTRAVRAEKPVDAFVPTSAAAATPPTVLSGGAVVELVGSLSVKS